ncbi:hypothetical protein [Amycolatopsis thermoflava]|uniref:hypothetical protein n=1 Tax=Amycolatopsis thermoflava TaxID=84480 RepID=UPI0004118E5E|nr:hypothetical protein [Amycolatopsis thermoflava]
MANVILCEGVTDPPGSPHRRCIPINMGPGCDPRCQEHQQPTGYIDRAEWAEYMLITHDQRQCPGCGLWTIWEPREGQEGPQQ